MQGVQFAAATRSGASSFDVPYPPRRCAFWTAGRTVRSKSSSSSRCRRGSRPPDKVRRDCPARASATSIGPTRDQCWNADVVMYARGIAAVGGGQDICIGVARAAAARRAGFGRSPVILWTRRDSLRRAQAARTARCSFSSSSRTARPAATHAEWARRAGDGVGRVNKHLVSADESGDVRVWDAESSYAQSSAFASSGCVRSSFPARARGATSANLRFCAPGTRAHPSGYARMSSLRATRRVTSDFPHERLSSRWSRRHSRCINAIDVAAHQPLVRPGAAAAAATRQKRRDRGVRAQVVSAGEDTYVNIWSCRTLTRKARVRCGARQTRRVARRHHSASRASVATGLLALLDLRQRPAAHRRALLRDGTSNGGRGTHRPSRGCGLDTAGAAGHGRRGGRPGSLL